MKSYYIKQHTNRIISSALLFCKRTSIFAGMNFHAVFRKRGITLYVMPLFKLFRACNHAGNFDLQCPVMIQDDLDRFQ